MGNDVRLVRSSIPKVRTSSLLEVTQAGAGEVLEHISKLHNGRGAEGRQVHRPLSRLVLGARRRRAPDLAAWLAWYAAINCQSIEIARVLKLLRKLWRVPRHS